MFSMPLLKEFQFLQILKRPIKHLIKLILYENDVKLSKFKRSPGRFVIPLKCEILIIDT